MRHALGALIAISTCAATAAADIPGPNDEYCTVELQQQDGSRCEACHVVVTDPSSAHACDALEARGWTARCGRGATARTTIYCDRAGDFVQIGRGGGCAVGGGSSALWACSALATVIALMRRRSKAALTARAAAGSSATRSAGTRSR